MRKHLASILTIMMAGCATPPLQSDGFVVVSVAELNQHPARWDGQRVQVTGLVVAEFENLGLYSSWSSYCPRKTHTSAIYVRWDDEFELSEASQRRMAIVRGTFRNLNGVERMGSDGLLEMDISTGAPGPGPLEDVRIVRFRGPQLPFCER